MVTRRRQRCLGEKLGRDAELRKERTMQRALDNDRDFSCLSELHDAVRLRRFRGGDRQGAPEADQIMRILCDVVLEACPVENACRELSVERHGAYSLVGKGVAFPGLSRKRTGIDRSHWNLQERPARSRRWRRAGCAGPGPDAGGTRRVIWTRDYARY